MNALRTQIAARPVLPQDTVRSAAPFPDTHGNRGPVERGTTAAPDAPRGEPRLGLSPTASPPGVRVHELWWRP
jgi:hypothetical protein